MEVNPWGGVGTKRTHQNSVTTKYIEEMFTGDTRRKCQVQMGPLMRWTAVVMAQTKLQP